MILKMCLSLIIKEFHLNGKVFIFQDFKNFQQILYIRVKKFIRVILGINISTNFIRFIDNQLEE